MSTSVTIYAIQAAVCGHYRVDLADLVSDRREARIVLARHAAMWLARRLTRKSHRVIGRHFGGRDHSSVSSALARVEARIAAGDSGGIWRLLAELQRQPGTVWPQITLANGWVAGARNRKIRGLVA